MSGFSRTVGTIATQNANAVAITGGSVSGLSALGVAGDITATRGGTFAGYVFMGSASRYMAYDDGTDRYLLPASGLDLGGTLKISGTKVLGAQGASVADATDAGSAITQLNALLARCRAHGFIAT